MKQKLYWYLDSVIRGGLEASWYGKGFERTGTESLPNGANNYTLVWTESKSFWKIHQPCPQHLRQHQALGKNCKRKPQLSWGLAGMERGPSASSVGEWPGRRPAKEWAAACLPPSRKAGLAKCSCQIWLTSTNLGLPEAICNWNICLLSTRRELQKGRGLGKETLKMSDLWNGESCFYPADILKFR